MVYLPRVRLLFKAAAAAAAAFCLWAGSTTVTAQSLLDSTTNTFVFQPISSLTTDIVINERKSTQTVATFQVSDVLNRGSLYVGNFKVGVASEEPTWNYQMREVGRIPKAIISQSIKVCSVGDVSKYQKAIAGERFPELSKYRTLLWMEANRQAANGVSEGSGGTASSMTPLSQSTGRKLLQFSVGDQFKDLLRIARLGVEQASAEASTTVLGNIVDCDEPDVSTQGISVTYDYLWRTQRIYDCRLGKLFVAGMRTAKDVQGVNRRVTSAEGQLNVISVALNGMNTTVNSINENFLNQNRNNADFQNKINGLVEALRANYTNSMLLVNEETARETRLQVQSVVSNLTARMNDASSRLVQQMSTNKAEMKNVTDVIQQQLIQLAFMMSQISDRLEQQLVTVDAQIGDLNAQLFFELTQTTLRRAVSKSYFDIMSVMPASFIPLVNDPGNAPVVTTEYLTGEDARILLDTYTISHDLPPKLGVGPRQLVNTKVDWWIDSEYQLQKATAQLTKREILSILSGQDCARAFYDNTVTWATASGANMPNEILPANASRFSYCFSWLEVTTKTCSALSVTTSAYSPSLNSSVCNGAVTTTRRVLRNIVELAYFASTMWCGNWIVDGQSMTTPAGAHRVESSKTGLWSFMKQPTTDVSVCSAAVFSQMTMQQTVMSFILGTALISYGSITKDVLSLEQKKYGRLPGGLTYEQLPFDYVPPIPEEDESNTGDYSPRMCHRVTFNLAHVETTPVHALISDQNEPVTKKIRRVFTQIDNSVQLNYTQDLHLGQEVHFDSNIKLLDPMQHILPGSTLIVGNLDDPSYMLYDVPERLLDATNNVYARTYTPTYYMMPPGTTTTYTLPQFLNMSEQLYDARSAAVGANLFAVPFRLDQGGSPVCMIGGGVPTEEAMLQRTISERRSCNNPALFQWHNNTVETATLENTCGLSGTYKLYNRRAEVVQYGVYDGSAWMNAGSFAVHFLYEGMSDAEVVWLRTEKFICKITVSFTSRSIRLEMGTSSAGVTNTFVIDNARIFDLHKHSIFVIFSGQDRVNGATPVTRVLVVIDGWTEGFANFDTTTLPVVNEPGYVAKTWGVYYPVSGRSPVEAVYAMPWQYGSTTDILDTMRIESVRVCSYAVAENHCSPRVGGEVLSFSAPMNAVVEGATCPSNAVTLFRSFLVDASLVGATKSGAAIVANNQFAFTFWLHVSLLWRLAHSSTTIVSASIQIESASTATTLLAYVTMNGELGFKVQFGTTEYTLQSVTRYTTGSVQPHKVQVTYNYPTLTMFVDSASVATTTVTTRIPAASSSTSSIYTLHTVDALNAVSQVRFYPYVPASLALFSETLCDAASPALYINPVGYCRQPPASSLDFALVRTYCRSPAICNGNCETYARFFTSTSALAPSSFENKGVNTCDDGWLPPLCTSPCSHPHPLTNECLSPSVLDPAYTGASEGLVPAGQWCNILKFYKASVTADPVNPTAWKRMKLSPRSYIMEVTLPVPSGQFALEVKTTAACPLIQTMSNGISTFLLLNNPTDKDMNVEIEWLGLLNDCSSVPNTRMQIKGFMSEYATIPSCKNMTATLFTLPLDSQRILCKSLSFADMNTLVVQATTSQPTNIMSTSLLTTNAGLGFSLAVSNGLAMVMSVVLEKLGFRDNTFYTLYQAAQQYYLHNQNMSEAARALSMNFTFDIPQINLDVCRSEACRRAIEVLRNVTAGIQTTDNFIPIKVVENPFTNWQSATTPPPTTTATPTTAAAGTTNPPATQIPVTHTATSKSVDFYSDFAVVFGIAVISQVVSVAAFLLGKHVLAWINQPVAILPTHQTFPNGTAEAVEADPETAKLIDSAKLSQLMPQK